MGNEQTIQISLQLPVSELAGLTALAEHLRALLQTEKHPGVPKTAEQENSNFDMTRFRELNNDARSSAAEVSPVTEVTAVHPQVDSFLSPPESAGFHTDQVDSPSLPDPLAQNLVNITEVFYPESAQPMSPSDSSREHKEVSTAADFSDISPAAVPVTAGFSISGDLSAPLPNRQKLPDAPAVSSPVTVTAETVSQAFRRDDRRYDNGFPLY